MNHPPQAASCALLSGAVPTDSMAAPWLPRTVPCGTILCVGLVLAGDPQHWCAAASPYAAPDELERASRFIHTIDAARHLAGRALVRKVLAAATGVSFPATPFSRNAWGKPELPGSPVSFSISHAGTMLWTAFCRHTPVGIDVEAIPSATDVFELARMLHSDECAEIAALSQHEAVACFYRTWVRKEAVLKAVGEGLNRSLTSFRVSTGAASGNWLQQPPGGEGYASPGWTTADIAVREGYFCSVAAQASGLSLAVHHVPCPDAALFFA
ncbi:4'-phosphopantetheinyl transferase family protein [Desulfovibrio psychrotolerans]|uniref:4'-phosphopantetheinyl transferase n=1 Tax=Desulfovibrio psychrotolerans TaxID=415242 RepID=A0A7J0BXM0_9BACT|nr:4'-phosphopantetheinyl transferase superfamily protein [Desulfovibrio psychrotolerans]GFM38447.1 hypothetical protein DSM19430T_31310 [Desulfovibrio psychrotolerans]